jgi:hypothetical protein
MKAKRMLLLGLLMSVWALCVPLPAEAYVGAGSGATVIGLALAFLGSVVLVIVGFVWYPIKRVWKAISTRRGGSGDAAAHDPVRGLDEKRDGR